MEEQDLPEEFRCFLCVKLIDKDTYKVVLLAEEFETHIEARAVPVCYDCFDWTIEQPDAARALYQTRLNKYNEQDPDTLH